MRPSLLGLVGLAVVGTRARDYNVDDFYVLRLDAATSPDDVARQLGLSHQGVLGALDDHHIFSTPKTDHDVVDMALKARRRRRRRRRQANDNDDDDKDDDNDDFNNNQLLDADDQTLNGIRFSQKQIPRKPWEKRAPPRTLGPSDQEFRLMTRAEALDQVAVQEQEAIMREMGIADPIFKEQWHLINPVQVGHDVNVKEVWRQGVTGKNATVAIVDDGLDMYSDDLRDNYYAAGSYDFNDHTPEPKPRLSDDRHGTRCAGEVAAVRNDVCGVGVAYDAKVSGLRILSKMITDADESLAMMYDMHHNQIYSCSWGPPDDGKSMDAPGILIRQAMLKAIQQGRDGLGSIYVFASGNGANYDDNCNFDGYTNSIYSITVGAIDRQGSHPYYSEKCSAQLVVTYSSGSGDAIHTTDVGKNSCYSGHGGTSAAAPLAAGIFALVLEARPDLTWRDMQYLVILSAVPVNEELGKYQTTALGKKFSHMYGYGKIDSLAIVEAAKSFEKVKPQAWFYSPWVHVASTIPQNDEGLAVTFDVTPEMLRNANVESLEHVTVTMNVNHTRRGDLSVDLISPSKIVSHIATARKNDAIPEGYIDWTFMTVAHWGETGVGPWTIIIRDTLANEHEGTFIDFHLKMFGQAIDPAKAFPLPMFDEHDDDHAMTETTTIPGTRPTDVPPVDATNPDIPENPDASLTDTPDDHPGHRPTKIAPSDGDAVPTATDKTDPDPSQQQDKEDSNWVSWLPSLGVSTGAQVWIYGAIVLIAVFCVSLSVYMWLARRRARANNPRDGYEFELLPEDSEKDLRRGGRRQRGGELYDAFAGGSDDEDVGAELLSDDDDEEDDRYNDNEEPNRDEDVDRTRSRY